MDLHLQPRSDVCCVTGVAFADGDRVVSLLVRETDEFKRFDALASAEAQLGAPGEVLCRWSRIYKVVPPEANPERELKLTAESLFLSLTEEGVAPEENVALKQFLALMLERKRVLRNRGRSEAGATLYEHAGTKRVIEVPAGAMDTEFFLGVREKLGVLLGEPTRASERQAEQ